ncbi:MAG TPA: TonB-dependent receptor [Opitutaceae bacterium]|nr:TonB-dependent receptor [Opitutaceae bacterium]
MSPLTPQLTALPSGRLVPAWFRMLSCCLVLTICALPARAEADASDKDAQIADLKAEVERLKSLLGQSQATAAPAAAPAAKPAASSAAKSTRLAKETTPGSEKVYQMSAFEVRTTQGQGYSPGNSASALKTSEPLMKLPAQIIVVTSDMINDIGSHNASDVLSYAGLVPYYRGPAILSRGSRIGNPYTDDVPQASGIGISDNTNIDTYQVIKGPQQVLYPLASLGGLVLQTTKKPLPGIRQGIFDERVMQWGRHRFTFDVNEPLVDLGSAQITGRVTGIWQEGQGPFYNSKDDRYGIFPNFSLDWKDTHLVLQYGAEIFHYLPGGTGILTPDGNIYVGMGHRNQGSPRNNNDKNEQHDARLSWTQELSPEWQVKSQVAFFNVRRYGSTGFPTGVNWNNNTVTYTIRKNNGWQESLDIQTDVSGKYDIASLPTTSAFGFNFHDQSGLSAFWITTPITVNIGDANAINAIVLPSVYDYVPPANPGSRTKQYVTNGYFMQTLDIIPNKLTLAGGLTYSMIETIQDTNLALRNPFTATDSAAHELLHRVAVVYSISKELTAYVSESTTFNPAVGVTYDNTPLPSVLGKSDEVGVKAAFMDGKVSASFALYKMTLTNQAILAAFPALNVAGLNYYIPIGSTTSRGWDTSLAISPVPGLQIVATGYMGTVKDQNDNPITGTVENSWSLFGRYDFQHDSGLKGFSFGGGAQKAGGKWFNMAGLTLPGGVALPKNSSGNSLFKLKQEVLLNMFAAYQVGKHWIFRVDCVNVLDKKYPIGAQGVGLADAVDPRTFSFQTTYKY